MKLTILQSDKGDCLLLSAGPPGGETHVLVDGGMAASFRDHVARRVSRLPQLDLVLVSHIDEDHITGVLQMVNDAFDWRVYEFRKARGVSHPKPKSPQPPPMKRIWHNAFHDQVDRNVGAIEDIAIATASFAAASPELAELAAEYQNLANSIPQAIQLSQRISSKQLGVKHNQGKGKLLMAKKGARSIRIGPMRFTLIGPFPDELEALREEWDAWVRVNDERIAELREKAAGDAGRIAVSTADEIRHHLAARADELGKRSEVTVPNLASLMCLVEEDGRTLLLTGDGHHSTILRGLVRAGRMQEGGSFHVHVMKVQHHGSEHNLDADFCRRVTADHYVFCGNGAHHNPDLRVVETLIEERLQSPGRFKLWFNSHSSVTKPSLAGHMEDVEELVGRYVAAHPSRVRAAFLDKSAFPPLTI